ncbi:response regulator, partial [Pseudoalteromonas sp. RB2-MNA-CIBAN-0110]|uniref:response regulator n=1 Tax=Pseudoalteromonas sp. RB2-MNA-CIBAN-0110 TaxID=3140439 RepID=UPI003318CBCC
MSDIMGKGLVYIVEDSIASGALYASQLEQVGFECKHFADGYSALVGIKEKMPAVIVQDVCLPDISGLEVLQFVNKQKNPANVVMITSNSSIDIAVEAMRLGGFDFLEKPFTSQRLISSVCCDSMKPDTNLGGIITTQTEVFYDKT